MIFWRSCVMAEAVTAMTGIAARAGVGAQLPQRLDAVDAGQLDVHQDQAGCCSRGQPHAVLAGLGLDSR